MERPVSGELMRFHRREQMNNLRAIFRGLLKFQKGGQLFPDTRTLAIPDSDPNTSIEIVGGFEPARQAN